MTRYMLMGIACVTIGLIILYAIVTGGGPPLPPDLLDVLAKGKVLNVVPEACWVVGEHDLYKAFLDTNDDGDTDVGIMGPLVGKKAGPPYVWVFYGKGGEPEKGILTIPGQEIKRVPFEELVKLYPSPCDVLGRRI